MDDESRSYGGGAPKAKPRPPRASESFPPIAEQQAAYEQARQWLASYHAPVLTADQRQALDDALTGIKGLRFREVEHDVALAVRAYQARQAFEGVRAEVRQEWLARIAAARQYVEQASGAGRLGADVDLVPLLEERIAQMMEIVDELSSTRGRPPKDAKWRLMIDVIEVLKEARVPLTLGRDTPFVECLECVHAWVHPDASPMTPPNRYKLAQQALARYHSMVRRRRRHRSTARP